MIRYIWPAKVINIILVAIIIKTTQHTGFGFTVNMERSGGAVYIRWGRTECPATAEVVYAGFVRAPRYKDVGGSNYLCLPFDPDYHQPQSGIQSRRSFISTVEYRPDFDLVKSIVDHDVPCVVCESTSRSTALVIPGRVSCQCNWTREYYGFLVAP